MDLSHTPNETLDAVLAAAARQSHSRPRNLSREAQSMLGMLCRLSEEVRETPILDVFREKQARKARVQLFRAGNVPVWKEI